MKQISCFIMVPPQKYNLNEKWGRRDVLYVSKIKIGSAFIDIFHVPYGHFRNGAVTIDCTN